MDSCCERIELLKVPVDIVRKDSLEEIILSLLKDGKPKNIALVSLWDIMKARRPGEYRDYIQNAALVIPVSKSIVRGSEFLTGKKPECYMPFDFIITLLTILERRESPIYLLGGKFAVLNKAEKHIRETFPKLRVIGRHPGKFKKRNEAVLLQVVRKSAPALLMVNAGVHGGERWIARNSRKLNAGLRLWCSDIFDVFAERRRHPSKFFFESGFEWLIFCIRNPLRTARIFPYIYYNILLVFNKFLKK